MDRPLLRIKNSGFCVSLEGYAALWQVQKLWK